MLGLGFALGMILAHVVNRSLKQIYRQKPDDSKFYHCDYRKD